MADAVRAARQSCVGTGHERADHLSGGGLMRPEHGERITVAGADDGGDVVLGGLPGSCAHTMPFFSPSP